MFILKSSCSTSFICSPTCHAISSSVLQLHLIIQITLVPSAPHLPFLLWLLLCLLLCLCYHTPTSECRNLFFCCRSISLHIHSILCSRPFPPQVPSHAVSLYIACAPSCSSSLRSAFRQSGMLWCSCAVSVYCVLRCGGEGWWLFGTHKISTN